MPGNNNMTLICPECEVRYPEGTNFCRLCGSSLEKIRYADPKPTKKKGFFGELEGFIENTATSIDKATSSGTYNNKNSDKNICPHCKGTLRPNIKFCNHCGTKLNSNVKSTLTPASPKKDIDEFKLLERLAELHNKGVLTTEEFNEQKRRILDI